MTNLQTLPQSIQEDNFIEIDVESVYNQLQFNKNDKNNKDNYAYDIPRYNKFLAILQYAILPKLNKLIDMFTEMILYILSVITTSSIGVVKLMIHSFIYLTTKYIPIITLYIIKLTWKIIKLAFLFTLFSIVKLIKSIIIFILGEDIVVKYKLF